MYKLTQKVEECRMCVWAHIKEHCNVNNYYNRNIHIYYESFHEYNICQWKKLAKINIFEWFS